MERFMYQDDSFEHVLKQKADEYRMYPSDQSWEMINRRLHQPNRFNWKAASLFTTGLLTIGLWVSVNQHKVKFSPTVLTAITAKTTATNHTDFTHTAPAINAKQNISARKSLMVTSGVTLKTVNEPVLTSNDAIIIPLKQTVIAENNAIAVVNEESPASTGLTFTDVQELKSFSKIPEAGFAQAASRQSLSAPVVTVAETTVEEADESKTDADLNYEVHVPVTIQTRKPKAELQLHFTPSASYRVLVSDNRFNFGNLRDPNSAVKQRTSVGMEAGITFIKPISKAISFTAGLQFNFTNYVLVSSRYNPELATVILNSARNVQRYTSLRTSNGYFPENITNRSYQLSAPVGVQIRLLQTKKFSWNLGTSLQPTYLLNATGYLVTNDYKNYIKAPEFLRNFNLNYSLESFLRFTSGSSTQIIAGPQFRYQLFSHSKENYPVQEHLVDYGFRIGMIKTFR